MYEFAEAQEGISFGTAADGVTTLAVNSMGLIVWSSQPSRLRTEGIVSQRKYVPQNNDSQTVDTKLTEAKQGNLAGRL